MMTFRQLLDRSATIPTATGWMIGDLGICLGKQELYTRQSPQKLKTLREHALIESAVSSNRIEGVEVEASRVTTLVFGSPAVRDRDEQEVLGYRSALDLIHREAATLAVTPETVKRLHRLTRGDIWDAGEYERHPDGRSRVRFMPVEAGESTLSAVAELTELWAASQRDRLVNPFVAMGAFVLDFLCIHPFRDGNGRVSRLLMLVRITPGPRSGATSASNGSSSRIRIAITKHSSKARRTGTPASTIPGPLLTTPSGF